mmetsp:Transcript_36740/g.77538  ORF Transcript_36740/g.77538 Transcript_36740/m.77538 type:complete len:201 (-) Transcript_36740:492-1094(-)
MYQSLFEKCVHSSITFNDCPLLCFLPLLRPLHITLHINTNNIYNKCKNENCCALSQRRIEKNVVFFFFRGLLVLITSIHQQAMHLLGQSQRHVSRQTLRIPAPQLPGIVEPIRLQALFVGSRFLAIPAQVHGGGTEQGADRGGAIGAIIAPGSIHLLVWNIASASRILHRPPTPLTARPFPQNAGTFTGTRSQPLPPSLP